MYLLFKLIKKLIHILSTYICRNNNRTEIMVKYEEEECSLLEQISSEESTIQ